MYPQHAPVLVLVHGVHYLGIEEPRLQTFARGLAKEGVIVFTPELPEASRYVIAASDIDVIGQAALIAKQTSGAKQVGLMGLSFSGGLALMAAAEPLYASSVRYVIAVGAHDSMQRVTRFYGTDREEAPDGTSIPFAAHEYGQLVMVYAHPEDYFPAADAEQVRGVIGPFLRGDVQAARAALPATPSSIRQVLSAWIDHHRDGLGKQIVASIPSRESEMAGVSPHGRLAGLKAEVLLLHGAGDNVIPPTETEFLANDIPRQLLVEKLISPAVTHVEVKQPGTLDDLRLLHWMARMMEEVQERGTHAAN
ncbi:MAG: hypothetical protein NVS9B15_09720 [Acidobacteriaceae bacterium]